MGFIGELLASTGAWTPPSIGDEGGWRTLNESGGLTGAVTEEMALRIPTVWDCNYILADSVGQIQALLYDRTEDGGRKRATGPLDYLLREQWNEEQSAIEFKRQMQQSANFYPNSFAEIVWDQTGVPKAVYPMHPSRVRRESLGGRAYRYAYLEDDARTWRKLPSENVLRVPGKPVLKYAEQTFIQALSLMRYSTNLFTKGPRPSTAIRSEAGVRFDQSAKDRIRAEIESDKGAQGGMVWIPEGLNLAPFGMTNRDAELNLVWSTVIAETTRFWRIPAYMVGLLESGTVSYASVDTQSVDFVVYCLMPWLVGWEQAIGRDMIVAKDSQFAEFLAAALLRGTAKERYEVYHIAIQDGVMSPNDVRRLENMAPRAGGDEYVKANKPAPTMNQVDKGSPAAHLLESLTRDAAGRAVRRETGALATLAGRVGGDPAAWEAGVKDFYAGHASFVADALKVPPAAATAYADTQMWTVLSDGPAVAATWYGPATDRLVTLALEAAR
jgi:HK97 family phage portal protein